MTPRTGRNEDEELGTYKTTPHTLNNSVNILFTRLDVNDFCPGFSVTCTSIEVNKCNTLDGVQVPPNYYKKVFLKAYFFAVLVSPVIVRILTAQKKVGSKLF